MTTRPVSSLCHTRALYDYQAGEFFMSHQGLYDYQAGEFFMSHQGLYEFLSLRSSSSSSLVIYIVPVTKLKLKHRRIIIVSLMKYYSLLKTVLKR